MLGNLAVGVTEVTVGGKLITVDCTTTENLDDEEMQKRIKMRLAHDMAMFMVQNDLIEFTQMPDPNSWATRVRARAYLSPDDQVKYIRLSLTEV